MTDTLKRLALVIEQVGLPDGMTSADVTPDKRVYTDFGFDSLDVVEMVMDIEDEFDLPPGHSPLENVIDQTTTVGGLVNLIEQRNPS